MSAEARPRWRLALVLVLFVAGLAWGDLARLPLSGEDWAILSRLRNGEVGSPHTFRPLSDAWLCGLHALRGPDARVLHAGSLFLHGLDAALFFFVALELLGSAAGAATVALVFALGAGALDALAWVAAVNRPLSAAGALLAWLGLLRLETRARSGLALLAAGVLVQLLANEEVYGTALLALVWLAATAWRAPAPRRPAALAALLVVAALLAHFFALERAADPARHLHLAPGEVALATATRAAQIAAGFSLPAWCGPALPLVALLVLALLGRGRLAAFGALAWLASLVPFVFSEASRYRAYPTQAPTALLAGAAAWLLLARLGRGRAVPVLASAALAALAWFSSEPPRRARLARWNEALAEVRVVAPAALALAREGGAPPGLVNLEPSSAGPFCYAFGIADPTRLSWCGFLDAASAYEEPGARPLGVWYGRRFDGTYGRIEPALYFAQRPRVQALRFYDRALAVSSLAAVERALRDPAVDVTTTAVVEAPPSALDSLRTGAGAPGTLEVLAPFEFGVNWARMSVAARTSTSTLLVYQEHWLYEFLSRLSADQALRSDQEDLRRVQLEARERGTHELLPVFRANAYGFAVLLAPGEHELELAWSVRREP